jgi:hypothetical protein
LASGRLIADRVNTRATVFTIQDILNIEQGSLSQGS